MKQLLWCLKPETLPRSVVDLPDHIIQIVLSEFDEAGLLGEVSPEESIVIFMVPLCQEA